MNPAHIYGLMAEFETPDEILNATRHAYAEGYRRMDAYGPMPVEGLPEALGFHKTRVPLIVLLGGLAGCFGGFFMQYWCNGIDYPINVGGRPLYSWPMFIPITFEMTVLIASLSAVVGMLALNGFPRPYHPVFNAPRFTFASRNRFFLCIEASDPLFDPGRTKDFLAGLEHTRGVSEVER